MMMMINDGEVDDDWLFSITMMTVIMMVELMLKLMMVGCFQLR